MRKKSLIFFFFFFFFFNVLATDGVNFYKLFQLYMCQCIAVRISLSTSFFDSLSWTYLASSRLLSSLISFGLIFFSYRFSFFFAFFFFPSRLEKIIGFFAEMGFDFNCILCQTKSQRKLHGF